MAELSAAIEKSGAYDTAAITGVTGNRKFSAAELQRILEAADMDGDGTLSYNELVLTVVQRKLSAKEERLWIAFSKIDLNRDGSAKTITRQQRCSAERRGHKQHAAPRC